MMRPTFAAACVAIFLLAACGGSPKERYYTLSAPESPPARAGAAAFASSIAVGPVSVPAMIDQPQIVARIDANQVAMHEYHRWASPLKDEIARVIAANLGEELGTARVWSYAQVTLPKPDYQVLVDVQRFDATLGDSVAVDALWTIRPADGAESKTGRSSVREPASGAGFDALAAAQSRALARVSQDIAAAIRVR